MFVIFKILNTIPMSWKRGHDIESIKQEIKHNTYNFGNAFMNIYIG